MKKTFIKNLLRDIRGTLSRFLSILIIIAVGVAFYAGVRATSPDMMMSADYYFKKNGLMDFKLISILGLSEDDIREVKKISGVTDVEGAYSTDALVEKNQHSLVLNILSIPINNSINNFKIVRGRTVEKANEAVVEEKFLKQNNYKLGDKILLKSGNDTDISDKLKNCEFEIVGTAQSPLFISAQRQLSSVGNGSVRGFVYVLPEVFKSDVLTEAYVRTQSNLSDNSMLNYEKYKELVALTDNELKKISEVQSELRYNDILNQSSDKIRDAEVKLEDSKKEAYTKFSNAEQQLKKADSEIIRGYEELKNNQSLFDQSMADGEKQIADGKQQITSAEADIALKSNELDDGRLQLDQSRKQLSSSEVSLNSAKQQSADSIAAAVATKINELDKMIKADPQNQSVLVQYQLMSQLYENCIKGKDFDSMYASLEASNATDQLTPFVDIRALKDSFVNSANEISKENAKLLTSENTLNQSEVMLQTGKSALENNKKKLSDSEFLLNKARQEGLAKLEEGRKKLLDSQKDISRNKINLNSEKENTSAKFIKAEEEIQKNKNKLSTISKQDWYILGRSSNIGYETYRQDSERLDNIGKSFPLIFFLVAALVSLTTMTRMVQEKRIEIGTFKALGYSRSAIVAHYMIYSLSASVSGSIIGVLVGFKLFPPLIMNAYSSLYTIPYSITPYIAKLALQASLIAIIFTTFASVMATLDELREQPASLMRPKPPKLGKSILLEKITFIWKRFNFTQKVTARNIFRYKQRFFMTVIGIAACTGLLITGFGLKGAIIEATNNQFNTIYKYDLQASLNNAVDNAEKDSVKQKILSDNNIKSVLFTYTKNSTVKKNDSENQDAYLVVPENGSELSNYINLTMNDNGLQLGDEGVIITEKLSSLLRKNSGDTIEITVDNKTLNAVISGVTEQYIQHYIYISPAYFRKLSGEGPIFNNFYSLLQKTDESSEDATTAALTHIDNVGSLSIKNKIQIDYGKSMDSIDYVVLVLIISAGVLAFVVIYNLIDININERKSELATIKLLGFFNRELASYIYRENFILTIIGSLLGLGLGVFEERFVISSAETNILMFYKKINPMYFVWSIMLTIVFSLIVNLIMYRRFERIDMIESLKNPE